MMAVVLTADGLTSYVDLEAIVPPTILCRRLANGRPREYRFVSIEKDSLQNEFAVYIEILEE